jgi:hypothetical protein
MKIVREEVPPDTSKRIHVSSCRCVKKGQKINSFRRSVSVSFEISYGQGVFFTRLDQKYFVLEGSIK